MAIQFGSENSEALTGSAGNDIIAGGIAGATYQNAVTNLADNGVTVAGYVYSGYGSRPLTEIQQDIWLMSQSFAGLKAVFIDEVSGQTIDKPLYQAVVDYAHGLGLQVIFNPGILPADMSYLAMADTVVVGEDQADVSAAVQAAADLGYEASRIAGLEYGLPPGALAAAVAQLFASGAGYAYVTEDGGANPWDSLSSAFSQEVTAAVNAGGQVLLPLYVYPDATVWPTVANGGAAVTAIVNPNNGPQTGNDTLRGGAGNDTLLGFEGRDALYGDEGADSLYGGAGADSLTGGNGDDFLDGGSGADNLVGGAGNDSYRVDSGADVIKESSSGGIDLVLSSLTRTLGSNLENLTLTGNRGIDGTGNSLANQLQGNDGNNLIAGLAGNDSLAGGDGDDTLLGGKGLDTLAGGDGADTFVFNTAAGPANVDRITDFETGIDRIQLDDDCFTTLGRVAAPTALAASRFYAGTAAHDSDDRFIYDQATGSFYYDRDGTGQAAQVKVAVFDSLPELGAGDIWLVS